LDDPCFNRKRWGMYVVKEGGVGSGEKVVYDPVVDVVGDVEVG
jgi:hypothetical protein